MSRLAFLALLLAMAASRLIELAISTRHQRLLTSRGATLVADRRFGLMVTLHTAILCGAAIEVFALHRPLVAPLAIAMIIVFTVAEAVRWWVIRTLGQHWNVRVMNSMRLGVVSTGPFRFVRHPNYAAVFVEMTALPLIHTAWLTACVGAVAHLWVLSRRVALEDSMLLSDPAYRRAMGWKPRFVPTVRRRVRPSTVVVVASILAASSISAEPVTVRYNEGIVHGFLVLRTLEGKALADGDLLQTARGTTVTSRLVFRFKDGSIHDETAVFSQRGHFKLLTDHLVQKGPTFPRPLDMSIDTNKGEAVVRYADDDGKEKTESEHMQFAPDVANGLVLTLLKNVRPDAAPKSVGFIAATPKPQAVKLEIGVVGRERFSTAGMTRTATHYVLKVDIGGLKGVIAPLVGKQPPDSHVWILGGEVPAFVKSEQPLYMGGPLWRIELVSPVWQATAARKSP